MVLARIWLKDTRHPGKDFSGGSTEQASAITKHNRKDSTGLDSFAQTQLVNRTCYSTKNHNQASRTIAATEAFITASAVSSILMVASTEGTQT